MSSRRCAASDTAFAHPDLAVACESESGEGWNSVGFGRIRLGHVHPPAILIEDHSAVHESENRVITAQADISARMPFRPTLTHNDIARADTLSSELLHSQTLGLRISTVA